MSMLIETISNEKEISFEIYPIGTRLTYFFKNKKMSKRKVIIVFDTSIEGIKYIGIEYSIIEIRVGFDLKAYEECLNIIDKYTYVYGLILVLIEDIVKAGFLRPNDILHFEELNRHLLNSMLFSEFPLNKKKRNAKLKCSAQLKLFLLYNYGEVVVELFDFNKVTKIILLQRINVGSLFVKQLYNNSYWDNNEFIVQDEFGETFHVIDTENMVVDRIIKPVKFNIKILESIILINDFETKREDLIKLNREIFNLLAGDNPDFYRDY